jgi:hypothetical protein
MQYFIHDLDAEPPNRVTLTNREHLLGVLGPIMLEVLEDTGSLSQGTTVYEARRDAHAGLFTNSTLIAQVRAWVVENFTDGNSETPPERLFAIMEAQYEGGIAGFIRDQEAKPESDAAATAHRHVEWKEVVANAKRVSDGGNKDQMIGHLAQRIVELRVQLRELHMTPRA